MAAASYEARRFGAHSAMPMSQAVRRCPQAVVLRPRFDLYCDYSGRVMSLLREAVSLPEQMSIDEAYLELAAEVSSIDEAGSLMRSLQERVAKEVGLACSVGQGSNKLVAKVACETGKPWGFVVVQPGGEASFLAELPVEKLPGIGPRSAERLKAQGFDPLGKVAQATLNTLTGALGPWGAVLEARTPPRSIPSGRPSPLVARRHLLKTSTSPASPTRSSSASPGESLRKHGLVTLKLRYAEFTTITRSMRRPNSTATDEAIVETARHLLDLNWSVGQPVRLIGVGVSNLSPLQTPGQLTFDQGAAEDPHGVSRVSR